MAADGCVGESNRYFFCRSTPSLCRGHEATDEVMLGMPEQMTTDPADPADLFEIISTTRSMRRLKADPVPTELLRKILEAGVCAPSGGNMQRWRFLLVRDPKLKQAVGALYRRAWDEIVAPRYRAGEPAPGTNSDWFLRMLNAAEHLGHH